MPIKNVGFPKMKSNELSFDLFTWRTLATLLNQQRPFEECLLLIETNQNQKMVAWMRYQLEQGISIEEIVSKLNKDAIALELRFYLQFLPFSYALQAAVDVVVFEKKIKQKLAKILFYPCGLILFSFLILFLFSTCIMPNIMTMFQEFDFSNHSLVLLLKMMNQSLLLFFALVIGFVLWMAFYFVRHRVVDLWLLFHRVHLDSFFQKYASYVFAQYLAALMKHGLSTRQSLVLLQDFKTKPLIAFLGRCLNEQFMKGESFEQALSNEFLDRQFCFICMLGYNTNTFLASLEEYQQLVELWLEKKLKRLSTMIQLVSYSCIGMIVIVVYQMMLLPLSVLEQM